VNIGIKKGYSAATNLPRGEDQKQHEEKGGKFGTSQKRKEVSLRFMAGPTFDIIEKKKDFTNAQEARHPALSGKESEPKKANGSKEQGIIYEGQIVIHIEERASQVEKML